jgi:hypothetical protein
MWTLPILYDKWASLARLAADVVIVPSSSEAFGLVAAEAQAFGSIPIVSWVGGLRDVVQPRYSHIKRTANVQIRYNDNAINIIESCIIKRKVIESEIFTRFAENSTAWNGAIIPFISSSPQCEKLNSFLFASTIVDVLNDDDMILNREYLLTHLVKSAPRWTDGSAEMYTSAIESSRKETSGITIGSYLVENLFKLSQNQVSQASLGRQEFLTSDILNWKHNFISTKRSWRPFPGGDACVDVLTTQASIKMSSDGSGTCGYLKRLVMFEPLQTSIAFLGSATTVLLNKRSSLVDYGIRITAEFLDGSNQSETTHFSYYTIGWQVLQGTFNHPPRKSPVVAFTVYILFGEDGSAIFKEISAWLTQEPGNTKTLYPSLKEGRSSAALPLKLM